MKKILFLVFFCSFQIICLSQGVGLRYRLGKTTKDKELASDPPFYLPSGESWNLTAYRLDTGVLTYSATVYGEDAAIPLSTFQSGKYYLFRGEHGGYVYTCTVLIP